MKKKIFLLSVTVLLLSALLTSPVSAVSYPTFTGGPGGTVIDTQTAYEPSGIWGLGLNNADDLFYDDDTGHIFIADTGNARIAEFDMLGTLISEIGVGVLKKPTGLAVRGDYIYAADKDAGLIHIFDRAGNTVQTIERPTEAFFGKSTRFLPTKLEVDAAGNILTTSEGSVNGIMQLKRSGEFLGFVGANITPISLSAVLKNIFFSAEQKEKLMQATPPSPTAITLSEQGLMYTVTNGAADNTVKKLNTLGNMILSPQMAGPTSIDIAVDADENMYVITSDGYVVIFDSFGELLFAFGGTDLSFERLGFLRSPAAIDVTENGQILVLDRELSMVVVYTPTQFCDKVLTAAALYKDGRYVESRDNWQEILKLNSGFILSYKALASADLKEEKFDTALSEFRFAEDRAGYSDAFWEVRNVWIRDYVWICLLAIILLFAAFKIFKFIRRKKIPEKAASSMLASPTGNSLPRQLLLTLRLSRHPIDTYYEIKKNKKASVLSASILYIWFILVQIAGIFAVGFLFNNNDTDNINLLWFVFKSAVPLVLWIAANYLVSTISNGEGSFKQVYISTIYALSPYLLFILPVMLLSNGLTYNESFIYRYLNLGIYVWCGINLFLSVKEIHNYTVKETIKNIILTLFTIALIVLFFFIIYILVNQEVSYFGSLAEEGWMRIAK